MSVFSPNTRKYEEEKKSLFGHFQHSGSLVNQVYVRNYDLKAKPYFSVT